MYKRCSDVHEVPCTFVVKQTVVREDKPPPFPQLQTRTILQEKRGMRGFRLINTARHFLVEWWIHKCSVGRFWNLTFLLSHPLITTGQLGSLLAAWHLFPNVCTFPMLSCDKAVPFLLNYSLKWWAVPLLNIHALHPKDKPTLLTGK